MWKIELELIICGMGIADGVYEHLLLQGCNLFDMLADALQHLDLQKKEISKDAFVWLDISIAITK